MNERSLRPHPTIAADVTELTLSHTNSAVWRKCATQRQILYFLCQPIVYALKLVHRLFQFDKYLGVCFRLELFGPTHSLIFFHKCCVGVVRFCQLLWVLPLNYVVHWLHSSEAALLSRLSSLAGAAAFEQVMWRHWVPLVRVLVPMMSSHWFYPLRLCVCVCGVLWLPCWVRPVDAAQMFVARIYMYLHSLFWC